MVWQIMFHDKDSQLVVNLDYQLVMKELALMITKTMFIRCYSIKCGLSWGTLQHNIMHYIIDLTIKLLCLVILNEQSNITAQFLI